MPTVHHLCSGVFLQTELRLSAFVTAMPTRSLGIAALTEYLADYAKLLGLDDEPLPPAAEHEKAIPVTAIVLSNYSGESDEHAIDALNTSLRRARELLSLVTRDHPAPFATLILHSDGVDGWVTTRSSRQRTRIATSNTGGQYESTLFTVAEALDQNDRLDFAMSLLHDAIAELHPQFRIARLFNCLEALAATDGRFPEEPPRKRIKRILGFDDVRISTFDIQGEHYRYDTIEIAGRLRDKLYHGAPPRPEHLRAFEGDAFELLKKHPHIIANELEDIAVAEIERLSQQELPARSEQGSAI